LVHQKQSDKPKDDDFSRYAPHGSERKFLETLAKIKARREPLPQKPPKKLRVSIEKAGGILPWVNRIPDRKELFLQLFSQEKEALDKIQQRNVAAQKLRENRELSYVRALAEASRQGIVSEETPTPYKKVRSRVLKAGGNISWLLEDPQRLKAFSDNGGVVPPRAPVEAFNTGNVATKPKPSIRSVDLNNVCIKSGCAEVFLKNYKRPSPKDISKAVHKITAQILLQGGELDGLTFNVSCDPENKEHWRVAVTFNQLD
tara:strand:+ start:9821 stop:10594 length:774 start_codon:yes stop_codon:yes gene_type:complete